MRMPLTFDEPVTVADLLDNLGDVPSHRVLLQPAPGTATEADLLRYLDAADKRLCELIDGVLVEKTMGLRESLLAAFLMRILDDFVRPRNLGILTGADGPLRLFAGRVRMPDVSFISWDRIPGRKIPMDPIADLAPDLAVEVLSVSNTRREMERKRKDYFKAGVRLVWEVDPVQRRVQVYTKPDDPITLTEADTLDGGVVLPGFALPLSTLFGELDRHG